MSRKLSAVVLLGLARIVAGHQGGTVVLEKIGDVWTAKALVNQWIA